MESSVSFEKGNEEAFQMAFREGCIHLKIDLSSTEVLEGDKLDASTMETFWLFLLELAKSHSRRELVSLCMSLLCRGDHWKRMLDDNKKVRAKLRELDQSFVHSVVSNLFVKPLPPTLTLITDSPCSAGDSGANRSQRSGCIRQEEDTEPAIGAARESALDDPDLLRCSRLARGSHDERYLSGGATCQAGCREEASRFDAFHRAVHRFGVLLDPAEVSIARLLTTSQRKEIFSRWKLLIEAGQREPPFGLAVRGSTLRSVGRLVEKMPPELRIWFTKYGRVCRSSKDVQRESDLAAALPLVRHDAMSGIDRPSSSCPAYPATPGSRPRATDEATKSIIHSSATSPCTSNASPSNCEDLSPLRVFKGPWVFGLSRNRFSLADFSSDEDSAARDDSLLSPTRGADSPLRRVAQLDDDDDDDVYSEIVCDSVEGSPSREKCHV
ncbi:G patch domain-containing protein 1 [Perkinsus olseni]|uniref:G patch domain-containing protein 1 n=1 Tax=Perkinsus olseni TaxID=32597 RepID=A0A7J6PA77_PEROL|nr:G patch domain-containing protein 1 [Perkinsus olseni]